MYKMILSRLIMALRSMPFSFSKPSAMSALLLVAAMESACRPLLPDFGGLVWALMAAETSAFVQGAGGMQR